MNIILKELDNARCTQYIRQELAGMLYFSDKISHDLNLSHGKFYTLVPEHVNPEHLYDFEVGGRIFPFKREEGQQVKQITDVNDNIIMVALDEYLRADPSNCLCFEDYSADIGFSYIRKSEREYYLIDNKVFYLIDNRLNQTNGSTYFKWAQGYGFLGMTIKTVAGLTALGINTAQELPDTVKDTIFNAVNSFFVQVYDGESYLLWIKDNEGKIFFDILSKDLEKIG